MRLKYKCGGGHRYRYMSRYVGAQRGVRTRIGFWTNGKDEIVSVTDIRLRGRLDNKSRSHSARLFSLYYY